MASTTIREHEPDNWTGTACTTNRRIQEHAEEFKQYLTRIQATAIGMGIDTIFITGFHKKIAAGALLPDSDQPMAPEWIKIPESDESNQRVAREFAELHLRIGIDPLK